MNALTLEEVEDTISGIYHWYAREAPGVQVVEAGHLGDLWALADRFYKAHADSLTPEESIREYGYTYA